VETPDAAFVRRILPAINWADRGYPLPAGAITPDNPDPLQFLVDLAADWVVATTGRQLDAAMPQPLVRMAQMAVALSTVAMSVDFSDDTLEALASGDVLASFSADGYAENYRDTGVALEAQRKALMLHPWAPLNRLLWALLTPAMRAYWFGFLMGGGIPSYGIVEMDWSGANRWGGVPGEPGAPGMAGDELAMRGHTAGGIYPTGSNTGIIAGDGSLD
jgi:hypothetical protein